MIGSERADGLRALRGCQRAVKLIDENGRVLGKINVFDLGVVVLLVVVLAFSFQAYRISTYPAPVIKKVEPNRFVQGKGGTLLVTGEHFDDRTAVKVGTGPSVGVFQSARPVNERAVEVDLPETLEAGSYFLILINRGNQMVKVEHAFEIVKPDRLSLSEAVSVQVKVKAFGILDELTRLIGAGDVETAHEDGKEWILAKIDRVISVTPAGRPQYEQRDKDVTLQLTLMATTDGKTISYKGEDLKVGKSIKLVTSRYDLPCIIIEVERSAS